MSQPALNRNGVPYHLPDFGPPARRLKLVFSDPADGSDLPALGYYECDADDLCCRAIDIWANGRVRLAFPGGLDGDWLPEGPLRVRREASAETRTMTRSADRSSRPSGRPSAEPEGIRRSWPNTETPRPAEAAARAVQAASEAGVVVRSA